MDARVHGPARLGVAPPGYRLPDATHVGTVHLQVSDLARSLDYYDRVLGLLARERGAREATLAAPLPGAARPLLHLTERKGIRPANGEFGLYHFAILLPDRAALGRFASNLQQLPIRMGMADHLVSQSFYLTDPDGLGIEVYADRPRDTWQARGQEVAMATDPLDVASVVAAAGGERWTGMPAGTTMGHMHLHVGDLQAADAYYHAALGFDRMVWSYPGALFLAAGGYHHHLGTNAWSRGPRAAPDQARLLHWELVVPAAADVAAATASLDASGYTTTDPWGTEVRIVS